MKKTVTILSAFLILLSGVHFTIATHYCNERLAGTKISLSGKTASCGMESPEKPGTPKPGAPGSNQINVATTTFRQLEFPAFSSSPRL